MVIIKADVPEALDQKFRETVLKRYGFKKGVLTRALIDAIEKWMEDQNIEREKSNQESDHVKFVSNNFPKDKYLALKNNEIIVETDNLKELWKMLPSDPGTPYKIITPNLPEKKKVKLGWRTSLRTKR